MNVLELLQQDGISPKRVGPKDGGEYHSPCPGCGGKDRFHCWPEQNDGQGSWWCRVCDRGGDNIQYLMDYRGMDFKEAAKVCGVEVSGIASRKPLRATQPASAQKAVRFTPSEFSEPTARWAHKSGELVSWAHRQLLRSPGQLDYLAQRGLSLQTVKAFKVGLNTGDCGRDLWRSREAWGLPRETKADGKDKKLWLPRGIVIPYIRNGQLVRVRIRRPSPRQFGPKYYVVPGSGMAPMVIRPEARAFVAVEAELDAILCAVSAPENVGAVGLGSLGTKPDAATDAILRKSLCILNALDFERVLPTDDSDDARKEAAKKEKMKTRQRDWWQTVYQQAERWPVPDGKDPGEAFQKGEDLRTWIMSGLPPVLTIGALSTGRDGNGERQAEETAPSAPPAPAQVLELHELLQGTPVCVAKKADESIGMQCPQAWSKAHWDRFRRIGDMVWKPQVFDWLMVHPCSLIGAENLLNGARG